MSTKALARCKSNPSSPFVSHDYVDYSKAHMCRFVFTPMPELEKKMAKDTTDLKKEVENLGKRLQYLETTHKNSTDTIAQIFGQSGGGRA